MPIVVTGPVNRAVRELVEDGTDPRDRAGFVTDPRRAVVVADDRQAPAAGSGPSAQDLVTVRAYEAAPAPFASTGAPFASSGAPFGPTGAALPLVEALGAPTGAFLTALRHAEQHCRTGGEEVALAQAPGRDVVLVGAGVVNLLTAWYLVRAGHRLRILDARPDPRTALPWTAYGCSRGGGGARMFTLTEADDYHARTAADRPFVNGVFRRSLGARGWNVKATPFTAEEERWISQFEAVPGWLAQIYNDDILSFNRESRKLWRTLREECPGLFEDVEYTPGVLRLYTDGAQLEQSAQRHAGLGALRAVLDPKELRRRHPGLAGATGELAGGLEVPGFTVDVHAFMARLVTRLEQAGAVFRWSTPVERLERAADGRLHGLRLPGEVVTADSYVFSPGAYGRDLLAGTRSAGRIHGVLGVWMELPNLAPELRHSLKIARRGHLTEDANVTLGTDGRGRPVLIVGSGYGYTGADPADIEPAALERMFAAVEDTCRQFFPEAYARAIADGSLRRGRRLCVRPWTSANLGVLETLPTTADGVGVITGGHNTGGFAQAPSVAQAVVAALKGRPHPMHELYHPLRLERFLHPAGDGHAWPRTPAASGASVGSAASAALPAGQVLR
ncbi:NAD(P)/FAD-dependent oxidoreductase [Streptomyces sp. 1331.2]|uniref:NAD(P)/FAD-dependent oxidoreductase n=1 Tax=Streptomyces sp. 1331.2 TaxID=1938835 RepID=UPI000BDC2347|nr:FAD-dependent oxidoreductase [Streptomyces sp. 1331.2]SOB79505.1 D-amino-acid dehydrogenase [Streptomyces sp. 1331.2]